ncbi:MAG: hypothetical protein HRT72_10135, partial [Flavobacteriales bacterium]|nr:hypothetical protein [Flavobacteriales bacterium]
MKLFVSIACVFFLGVFDSYGTHNRAGEITYRTLSQLEIEATVIIYTKYIIGDSIDNVDREFLDILWGDGTQQEIQRTSVANLSNEENVRRSTYILTHTYSGPGNFTISINDPNRNAGVVNIPSSDDVPFYIESTLHINSFLGNNNSPVLLNPPLDHAVVNQIFNHNVGAYDVEGDSISYRLIPSKQAFGTDVAGYTYPDTHPATSVNSLTIDPITGDLVWDAPQIEGEYNIAILIEEWRNGTLMGAVTRDMQIFVERSDNEPPVIDPVDDFCIEAGEFTDLRIRAIDPNEDWVILGGSGGPFMVNNPAVLIETNEYQEVETNFTWQTSCGHVRNQPYSVSLRAEDDGHPELVGLNTFSISVLAPAPENLMAVAIGSQINLNWDISPCSNAIGYNIYRRIDSANFIPDTCEVGVPAHTGYVLIATIDGLSNTYYSDYDDVLHGPHYCYVVTAVFADGAESFVSNESCTELKRDVPIITHVSVEITHETLGEIDVIWSMPIKLDQFDGPFEYRIYRSSGGAFDLIGNISSLTDTIFRDINLNTAGLTYQYMIEFYDIGGSEEYKIGNTETAPSVFLSTDSADNQLTISWSEVTPWTNDEY